MMNLPVSRLHRLLEIDPQTGVMTWKPRGNSCFDNKHAGKKASCKCSMRGYFVVGIDGKSYLAHRVIWAMINGRWPEQVDHINGDPGDNRPVNLREVSHQDNQRNRARSKNNASGATGVRYRDRDDLRKKWCAYIVVNSKHIHLGYFMTKGEAIAVPQSG